MNWWAAHPVLAGELHLLLAAGTLVAGTGAAIAADASPSASVLILTATTLVGALGVPGWAAGVLALVTWLVHTGVLVQGRGLPVGSDQAENLVLFAAAAGLGAFLGRRASLPEESGVKDASRDRVTRP